MGRCAHCREKAHCRVCPRRRTMRRGRRSDLSALICFRAQSEAQAMPRSIPVVPSAEPFVSGLDAGPGYTPGLPAIASCSRSVRSRWPCARCSAADMSTRSRLHPVACRGRRAWKTVPLRPPIVWRPSAARAVQRHNPGQDDGRIKLANESFHISETARERMHRADIAVSNGGEGRHAEIHQVGY